MSYVPAVAGGPAGGAAGVGAGGGGGQHHLPGRGQDPQVRLVRCIDN